MRKIISVALCIAVFISIIQTVSFAVTDNLLVNGDLESGTQESFDIYGPSCLVKIDGEYAASGEYGMLIYERMGKYSTIKCNIANLLAAAGPGEYTFKIKIKLKDATSEKHKAILAINYQIKDKNVAYYQSATTVLTDKWQELTLTKFLGEDILYNTSHVWLYPQVEGATNADFCIDDVKIVKNGEINGHERTDIDETPKALASEELIINGGFEYNFLSPDFEDEDAEEEDNYFTLYGPANDMTISTQYAHSGKNGMRVANREGRFSTVKYDATETYYDACTGNYRISMWLKLEAEHSEAVKAMVVVKYSTTKNGGYLHSDAVELTTSWQKLVLETAFDFQNLTALWIYPQVESEKKQANFIYDDLSLVKYGELGVDELGSSVSDDSIDWDLIKVDEMDVAAKIRVSVENREPITSVGAIRWDAWYGEADSVCKAVEKTLSPAKYHFRAPFFSTINDDGTVSYPETFTQELFDKEMEYAIDAGIDYFAYNWYSDGMQTARKLHLTSKYKTQVKFCVILGGASSDLTKCEIARIFQDKNYADYYMTVLGGRPLMYYFSDAESAKSDIIYYQALCKKLGIPMPYAVVLNLSTSSTVATGADAIGQYAVSGTNGESFESLVSHATALRKSFGISGLPFVPTVTTGWNSVTRYENPVSWLTVTENSWAQYPTADEIYSHLSETIAYLQTDEAKSKTIPNTCLIYAWNEHDEGGWICPTLAVDENGNQLYNEDGSKKIDTSRIEAVKKAISEYKQSIAPAQSEDVTAQPSKTSGITLYIIIAAAAVVVIGAGVTAIIIGRKKKNGKQD